MVLYVDCEEVARKSLEPRGAVDVNGNISIAKLDNSQQTVPVSFFFIKLLTKVECFGIYFRLIYNGWL